MMSKTLITIGIILIIIGLLLKFTPWLLSWFGKLPGDIFIDRENLKIFFPITSSVIISILLTVILNIIKRFFN